MIQNVFLIVAVIEYSDPYMPTFPNMRKYEFDLRSVDLTKDVVGSYDCVLLATDHDSFDYGMLENTAKLLVDTRGRYKEPRENIIRA